MMKMIKNGNVDLEKIEIFNSYKNNQWLNIRNVNIGKLKIQLFQLYNKNYNWFYDWLYVL